MKSSEAPTKPGAYMDEQGRIWLFELNPPSFNLKIRTPGGFITQAATPVGQKLLGEIAELRRMVPIARPSSTRKKR